jgi:SAM-dependent methyltransferase
MTWTELDWHALDRLRERFLSGSAAAGPYWQSAEDLANYDLTYAARIGWKWDHVLRELQLRGFQPGTRRIFDWGCGSGIASRRVIDFFGADAFDELIVWDHSPLACEFAANTARARFPSLRVQEAVPSLLNSDTPIGLLVISHVLNELSPEAGVQLRSLLRRAEGVLWVEPGTHAVSRQLGRFRDELRGDFRIVAPCTHELGCPMFAESNERHWCHFFAPPPSEIFADSNWVKFGQRAGIDLRSLPYAFVALQRSRASTPSPTEDWSHIIGRPEHFKPYARWLDCSAAGLHELELPKRAAPALFKQLERTKAPLVYRWQRKDTKVAGGETLAAHAAVQPPEQAGAES